MSQQIIKRKPEIQRRFENLLNFILLFIVGMIIVIPAFIVLLIDKNKSNRLLDYFLNPIIDRIK